MPAIFGMCSPNCVPGTLVLIGLKGPRTSALESGFRSQMSWWAGAPNMKQKMHDLALPNVLAVSFLACSALSRSGSISPIEDNPPARSHSRRVTPSHNRAGFMSNESTAAPRTDGICLRPMHCLDVDQTVSTGDSRRRCESGRPQRNLGNGSPARRGRFRQTVKRHRTSARQSSKAGRWRRLVASLSLNVFR